MSTPSPHPPVDQLRDFAHGRTTLVDVSTIEAHLAACPDCCDKLAAIPDDPLLEVIRRSGHRLNGAPQEPPAATTTAAPTLPRLLGYEVTGVLGRGGMGVVYLARQTALNRPVAVKMLLAGGHADPARSARFRTEAEAVGRL